MTTWAWERPETSQIDYGTVIFTPEGEETFAEEPVLPRICSVALLGDSTVACRYFPAANRPENHLLVRLQRAFPDQRFVVQNLAAAEEGNGLDPGRLAQIFAAIPEMHLVFLRCHIRETEEEGFQAYMRGLQACCDALRQQYPGVTVILETGIWIHHPAHFFEESQGHLAPMYNNLKAWAIEAGYPIIDIYQKMQAEAAKGNWDLRVRGLPTLEQTVLDDSFDTFFGDEPLFFANIHPNSRCLALIAEWEVALLKLLARKT
jgi:hypothetical protein